MIPAAFDYHRPETLDEALKLLKKHGDEAKVLSGGMSLLPMLKLRLASFAHLVDINRIPGLDYIKEKGGNLCIGAMTRQAALERSDLIRTKYPILADAIPLIADPLVRNRGTIGGNVANGDPGNDQPAIMLALGATFVAQGGKERTIPANQFYKGLYSTALAPNEILTEIRIPAPPPRSGGAYAKLKRKTGDFAVAAAAVAADPRKERRDRARRHRPHECGTDAHRGGRRREISRREDAGRENHRRGRAAGGGEELAERGPPRHGRIQEGNGPRSDDTRAAQGGAARRGELTMAMHKISVTINGAVREAEVESRLLLVHLIREVFRMTGTHVGCDTSHCGACTVHLDGEPVKSCTVLAVQADGAKITTVEGLAQMAASSSVQAGLSPRSTV